MKERAAWDARKRKRCALVCAQSEQPAENTSTSLFDRDFLIIIDYEKHEVLEKAQELKPKGSVIPLCE